MQPAKSAHAREMGRQDVLQKPAHPIHRFQEDGGVLAGFAVAIGPAHFSVRQQLHEAVGGGGFEDVTGEITEGVFAGAGCLATHIPMAFPNLGGHLGEKLGMFFGQTLLEDGAKVIAQGLMVEEELFLRWHPQACVWAEAAAGNEIMDVGMKNERARPGVEDAEHAQLGAQAAGIGGEVLQGLGAGAKEQVEGDL